MSRAKGPVETRVQKMDLPGSTPALSLCPFHFCLPWPPHMLCPDGPAAHLTPHWWSADNQQACLHLPTSAYRVVLAVTGRGGWVGAAVDTCMPLRDRQGSLLPLLENVAKRRKGCALLSTTPDWDCSLLRFLISAATSGVLGQHQQKLLLSHPQWKKC